ncbi:MAG: sensor histidine kinase [Sediminispirochaetaceae bacterium]
MPEESFDQFYREFHSLSENGDVYVEPDRAVNSLRRLSGAVAVAYNEVSDDQTRTITRAVSGVPESLEKAAGILKFPLVGTSYDLDPQIAKAFEQGGLVEFDSLEAVSGSQIPGYICRIIQKAFGLGKVFVYGMKDGDRFIADLVFLLKKGAELRDPRLVEIYCEHLRVLLQRQIALQMSVLNVFSNNWQEGYTEGPMLQALFQAADKLPDLIYQLDNTGTIVFINQAIQRYGYVREELLGTSILDIVHPDDREGAYWHLQERRRGERSTRDFEVRILTGSRQTAYLEVHERTLESSPVLAIQAEGLYRDDASPDSFYGTIGIGHDITREKLLHDELDHQAEIFRSMAEHVGDAVWVEEIEPHRVVYINPAAERMYRTMREQAEADPSAWIKAIHPEDHGKVRDFAATLSSIRDETAVEHRLIESDGSVKWVYSRMFPIRKEDGAVNQLVGIATDITRQKEATQELERKIEVEKEYIREVHHRVKNNLIMIDSMLNLELSALRGDRQAAAEVLQKVKGRIEAVRLVHEMLQNVSRERMVEITGYIRSLADNLCATAGCLNGKVGMEYDTGEPVWLPVQIVIPIGMILNELLTNAFKYAFPESAGGTIWVSFSTQEPLSYRIQVKDNGRRMPDAIQESGEGHIGMDLVRALARQIDGTYEYSLEDGIKIFSISFKSYPGA